MACACFELPPLFVSSAAPLTALHAQSVKSGAAAFENAVDEKPGNRVHVTLADLPEPNSTESVGNGPTLIPRNGAIPQVKPGYSITLYADSDFKTPRLIRTAPNGDLFWRTRAQTA